MLWVKARTCGNGTEGDKCRNKCYFECNLFFSYVTEEALTGKHLEKPQLISEAIKKLPVQHTKSADVAKPATADKHSSEKHIGYKKTTNSNIHGLGLYHIGARKVGITRSRLSQPTAASNSKTAVQPAKIHTIGVTSHSGSNNQMVIICWSMLHAGRHHLQPRSQTRRVPYRNCKLQLPVSASNPLTHAWQALLFHATNLRRECILHRSSRWAQV